MESEPFLIQSVIVYEVCDDDKGCVFFMIRGKADEDFTYVGEKFSF